LGLDDYIGFDIMIPIEFLGDSLARLIAFPREATRKAGYQLAKVQDGEEPDDWKPMPSIGKGVREIRVWEKDGTFRVIYIVKSETGVFVLHAFVKKSQATPKRDIELACKRLKEVP
jgi:phage-related protein